MIFFFSENGVFFLKNDNLGCKMKVSTFWEFSLSLCRRLENYKSTIYVSFLFTSSFAPLLLEPIGKRFGFFTLRILARIPFQVTFWSYFRSPVGLLPVVYWLLKHNLESIERFLFSQQLDQFCFVFINRIHIL